MCIARSRSRARAASSSGTIVHARRLRCVPLRKKRRIALSCSLKMLNRTTRILAAAAIALGAGTVAAQADSCSGHSHTTGTVLGAVGGGAIGSAATHGNLGGVVGGAVLGGLAGNAISRGIDCNHRYYRGHYYHGRYYHGRYYRHRYSY